MPLPDLHRAVSEHAGVFACERIHAPEEIKTVSFRHRMKPPEPLDAAVPDIGRLHAFYATMGSLLLYHDTDSGDAARYIAPPTEWADLQDRFSGWTEVLSDDERDDLLPDWIDHCLVIGETPRSGNYILMVTNGDCTGQVFEFDHDGFEFTEKADDLVDYVQRLLDLDGVSLTDIASHMRFADASYTVQWWILEMSDNRGNRVRTRA